MKKMVGKQVLTINLKERMMVYIHFHCYYNLTLCLLVNCESAQKPSDLQTTVKQIDQSMYIV